MDSWIQMVLTIVCAVIAASGFWAYISKRYEKKDVKTRMLVGLAHDRILFLGMRYVDRGYITRDEYENLYEYLYQPYEKMGGNGSAKRVMQEVNKLPLTSVRAGSRPAAAASSTKPLRPTAWKSSTKSKEESSMLSNKTYDVLKWIALYLLPALGTLYFALAGIWNFPYGEEVVGTITAVDTFLGVLLGISTAQYKKENAPLDDD
jgi:hypothetical protein